MKNSLRILCCDMVRAEADNKGSSIQNHRNHDQRSDPGRPGRTFLKAAAVSSKGDWTLLPSLTHSPCSVSQRGLYRVRASVLSSILLRGNKTQCLPPLKGSFGQCLIITITCDKRPTTNMSWPRINYPNRTEIAIYLKKGLLSWNSASLKAFSVCCQAS